MQHQEDKPRHSGQAVDGQEWTVEAVSKIYWKTGIGGITDAINAALTDDNKTRFFAIWRENDQLKQELAAERQRTDDSIVENVRLMNALAAERERREQAEEERDYYEARRGGECKECGSWVCPPLTCMSCLAKLSPTDELRTTNQKLTEQLLSAQAAIVAESELPGKHARANVESSPKRQRCRS